MTMFNIHKFRFRINNPSINIFITTRRTKSTFLKILSGEIEHDSGTISISTGERMAVLKQDHFAYDKYSVKKR